MIAGVKGGLNVARPLRVPRLVIDFNLEAEKMGITK